jgi:arginine N-succinyltransferase
MLIAQMRGVIDEHGHSPFYEAVTRPFFDVDFCELQDLLAMNRRFIFELLPHRPIYLSLLPKEAQAVVSQTHPKTAPALRLLEREGFKISRDLDLFDAGPKVECRRDEIRTVEHSVDCIVRKIDHVSVESDTYILSNQSINFRACLGRLEVVHPHEICIDPATAHALQVEEGDKVRYIEPRPKSSVEQSKTWQSANASV